MAESGRNNAIKRYEQFNELREKVKDSKPFVELFDSVSSALYVIHGFVLRIIVFTFANHIRSERALKIAESLQNNKCPCTDSRKPLDEK